MASWDLQIYGFAKTRPQLIPYGAFLVGTIVSSIIFYELPLDKNGLRNLLDPQNGTSLSKEFWLALIWSSLLSISGFLIYGIYEVQNYQDKGLQNIARAN